MYRQDLDNMNDQPANDAVAIELRDELESGKVSEGHKSTSRKALKEILKAVNEPGQIWNTIFTMSCAIAIFIDPLYCYASVIHVYEKYKCLKLDKTLFRTYIGLRSAVDVFYAIDFVSCCKNFWSPKSNQKTEDPSKPKTEDPSNPKTEDPISNPKSTEVPYLILVSFPLPEGLILSSICSYWDPTYALIISTPIQYSLRIYHIYVTLRQQRRPNKTGVGKWLKAVLDYLPFVLASHLFGALWYRLAVQRLVDCWKSHCHTLLGDPLSKRSRHFICEKIIIQNDSSLSKWDELCPVKEANPNVFDFGIYLHALQSNATSSTHVVQRISQSFWWALRNLSSFGSNLQTSLYTMEIFLSVMISISGMALFLVYLNARVQESQELLDQSKSKKKMQFLKLWLDKNDIRPNKDQMKTIMNNIHKLEENKDIDVQNMLSILPVDDKKSIIQLLCLASLKKVPVFENIDQNILIAICDHLKPVTYTEDSYIVQEGTPLGKMLFIVEGLAWTYTTSNIIDVGTLKRGDYYGEEVLTWAFQPPFFSGLPISTRTVMSQGKIEAFALRAGDLKSVVCKFGSIFGIR
ncbi:hypothetical protein ABKV19_023161 [Rosa sericea]